MIESFTIKNAGPLRNFSLPAPTPVNLIIGKTGSGKTFLLKFLYAAVRSTETWHQKKGKQGFADIIAAKLQRVFLTEDLGSLVTRDSEQDMIFSLKTNHDSLEYALPRHDAGNAGSAVCSGSGVKARSLIFPANGVVTLYPGIMQSIISSEDSGSPCGYDGTYCDLTRALSLTPKPPRSNATRSRRAVPQVAAGRIDFDDISGQWLFTGSIGNCRYSCGTASEGHLKLAAFDRLIANGSLAKNSVVFIDEIQSSLAPQTLCDFLDLLTDMAEKNGIQFFISSSSYFPIKKLLVSAVGKPRFVTCIELDRYPNDEFCPHNISDLAKGLPDNCILDKVVDLYDSEVKALINP